MIEIDVTATAAAPRAGGFAYARQSGQQVRLALAPQWAGLRVMLQFSDGANAATVPLAGDEAEIPVGVLGTPWKTLRLGITGYHPIVPHARAIGPFWCELGAIRPEGMMGQGDGGSGIDTSVFATKAELKTLAKQDDVDEIDINLTALTERVTQAETVLLTKAPTSAIITVTDGDGTSFLANDGQYKPLPTGGGTAPDLSAYLTRADAQNTYATQAALEAKPETTVTRASESGSWGSQSTYTIAQTGAGSLQLVKRVDREGAGTKTTMTLDGEQLATAAEIPDVSRFITSDALLPLATQAWVQEYIASLDGTNVAA